MYKLKATIFSAFVVLFIQFPLLSDVTEAQEDLLLQLPPDQRAAVEGKMTKSNEIGEELDEIFSKDSFLVERPEEEENINKCEECIFGYDLFKFSPSTFAPANIVPVSSTYALGPGDKLTVNLYGSQKASKTAVISRDGIFELPIMGSIGLTGLTFFEAQTAIKERAKTELIGTDVSISLNELRSITVYVLGEAYKPGAYTLSALSTVTNTLFISGGVNKQGSLRNIQIKRGGRLAKKYDLYDLLIKGDTSTDFRLEDGDTIFIPFIESSVRLGGSFKRPHLYETLEGETLKDIISLAGGFKNEVSLNPSIEYSTINRVSNQRDMSLITYNESTFNKLIFNGDTLNVSKNSGLKSLSIELSGEFKNPGIYSFSPGDTILDVVLRAGGYTKSSFTEGGMLLREDVAKQEKAAYERSADNLEDLLVKIVQDSTLEVTEYSLLPMARLVEKLRAIEPVGRLVTSFDTLQLKTDPYANLEVKNGDKIYIPKRPSSISVVGEVLKSTSMQFRPEYELTDYLSFAGGLNSNADLSMVYVISPDGLAKVYKRRFFQKSFDIIPGSTIVVPRDAKQWDALALTRIVPPILADLALTAAALSSINN